MVTLERQAFLTTVLLLYPHGDHSRWYPDRVEFPNKVVMIVIFTDMPLLKQTQTILPHYSTKEFILFDNKVPSMDQSTGKRNKEKGISTTISTLTPTAISMTS